MEGEKQEPRVDEATCAQNRINQEDSGRMLTFVLRTGKVRVKNIRYEAGELELTINAKIAPESLKEFAGSIKGLAGSGGQTNALGDEIANGETEVISRHVGQETSRPVVAEPPATPGIKETTPAKPEETASLATPITKPAGSPAPGLKRPAHIRYVCPKCKTPGAQPGDKVGAIVTCRRCGKAMRLTVKR